MSRYCGEKNTTPILNAASHWRDVALLGEGSVLSNQSLWTLENLQGLDKYFVQQPDAGEGLFLGKMQGQLAESSPFVKQLAAEVMWLLYLAPSSLSPTHKKNVIQTVWSWSEAPFPKESRWLSDEVLNGIGSAGPGFNINQWREFIFMVRFALALHEISLADRQSLLRDPWKFGEWLLNIPEADTRQLRHMLVFLLFPDQFERIFGQSDRRKILKAFKGMSNRDINKLTPLQIDRTLYELRGELEKEYSTTQLDFYFPPLKQRWVKADVATLTEDVQPMHIQQDLDEIDLKKAVEDFASALQQSNVRFGAQHYELSAAFVASLVSKPFVILTGLSGSGKTQIAMRFGDWLGGKDQLYVAAVRPDWTGPEALFGYEDGLKPAIDGRPAWAVPDPLKFILKAHNDPDHPYLLVLDEMNLAHVERYLADALSGIESAQPCIPNLEKDEGGLWHCKLDVPRVPWPRNLWIVGTVNVDETTYMFSPKVLDRANTFEFRVATDDLSLSAMKPSPCEAGEPALVRGILAISRDDGWHIENPATFQTDLAERLKQLHALLHRYNFEFGHRVFYEALRFAALAEQAGLANLNSALDRIMLQKILPRLHGSRRRLELPLLAISHYCRDLNEVAADEGLLSLRPEELLEERSPKLPLAHDKVCRMLAALRANQFASFTE